ncbi:MAG: PilT/PilU family type 4a pilus ATPase [Opitutales bacterium]|nr:PilT/PilU family type 4a pilus ATPase [Opitutales bacterium]
MDLTTRWFLHLCLCREHALLVPSDIDKLVEGAGTDDDAVAYGERILDLNITSDTELLQSLLDSACDAASSGTEPPAGPATTADESKTAALLPPNSSTTAAAAPSASGGCAESPLPADGVEPDLPDFPALEGAPDDVLLAAMIGLLRYASASRASDLHVSAGARPFVRRDRKTHYLHPGPITAGVAEGLNRVLLPPAEWDNFRNRHDIDFALPLSTGERYRANLMRHRDGYAGTYRTVNCSIQPLSELGFRNAKTVDRLLAYHNGLILVTGPVGSGKTTTLAALVQQLNQTRDDHLISVEDPIEFVHRSERCIITQRAVGSHTQSFHNALKGALRQDPDIIVIGEMRDLETIEMAISASETGHLVIGTMHTSDAATTLNRLLDVFPPAQQGQIRAMVAESLRGIVCQRLLPAKAGGMVLATEVLLRNLAVSALIREGKTQGLSNIIETGKAEGMVTMDSSVMELWREGRLLDEVALANLKSESARSEIRLHGGHDESTSEADDSESVGKARRLINW